MLEKHRQALGFLVLVLAILLLWYAGRYFKIDSDTIESSLRKLPLFYSGFLYVILYVAVTFFIFFAKDVFWLSGAVLFGVGWSTFFICLAEVINAFILFHLARRLGRAYVEKNIAPKYRHLDDKLSGLSFSWLFIFRAAPLIPYRFMDLGAGLTRISFRRYIAAVALGSPVKMFWIQYILYGVGKSIFGNPQVLVDYFLRNRVLFALSLIYIILIIMVVVKIASKD